MLKEFFIKYSADAIFDDERYEDLISKVNSEPQLKRLDVLKNILNNGLKKFQKILKSNYCACLIFS